MKYVEHTFGPGETIEAVIRLHNSHAMSFTVAHIFLTFYNRKNESAVPKLGDTVWIPVDARIAQANI